MVYSLQSLLNLTANVDKIKEKVTIVGSDFGFFSVKSFALALPYPSLHYKNFLLKSDIY
jgi:hypothetical protein